MDSVPLRLRCRYRARRRYALGHVVVRQSGGWSSWRSSPSVLHRAPRLAARTQKIAGTLITQNSVLSYNLSVLITHTSSGCGRRQAVDDIDASRGRDRSSRTFATSRCQAYRPRRIDICLRSPKASVRAFPNESAASPLFDFCTLLIPSCRRGAFRHVGVFSGPGSTLPHSFRHLPRRSFAPATARIP